MTVYDYPNIPPGYDEEVICQNCKKPFKKHLLEFKTVICKVCQDSIKKSDAEIVIQQPKKVKKKYSSERQTWLQQMMKRDQDQWCNLIDDIKNVQVRIQIASIVWWDFFADSTRDNWTKLNKYKKQWKSNFVLSQSEIYDALIFLGYLPYIAKMRSERKDQGEVTAIRRREQNASQIVEVENETEDKESELIERAISSSSNG